MSEQVRLETLNLIAEKANACTACELSKTRTNLVFGSGSPLAKVVFFGEGPGADEDAQGLPFVGRSGKLLTNMISSIGLNRDQVYIMNAVKCRPPNNRKPLPNEMDSCRHWFQMQLEIIKPKVIVALGATATEALCGPGLGITKRRGKWEKYKYDSSIAVLPSYHPAFLLRKPAAKTEAWQDLQMVKNYLR